LNLKIALVLLAFLAAFAGTVFAQSGQCAGVKTASLERGAQIEEFEIPKGFSANARNQELAARDVISQAVARNSRQMLVPRYTVFEVWAYPNAGGQKTLIGCLSIQYNIGSVVAINATRDKKQYLRFAAVALTEFSPTTITLEVGGQGRMLIPSNTPVDLEKIRALIGGRLAMEREEVKNPWRFEHYNDIWILAKDWETRIGTIVVHEAVGGVTVWISKDADGREFLMFEAYGDISDTLPSPGNYQNVYPSGSASVNQAGFKKAVQTTTASKGKASQYRKAAPAKAAAAATVKAAATASVKAVKAKSGSSNKRYRK
jgi:hypothetical protein